jgi:hypothetical protein
MLGLQGLQMKSDRLDRRKESWAGSCRLVNNSVLRFTGLLVMTGAAFLDEATSALDIDTEAQRSQLASVCRSLRCP